LVFALSNGKLTNEDKNPDTNEAYNLIAKVYGLFILAMNCYFTSSYEESIAKFKAMALMTVGVAPLQRAIKPYSFVILANALPTLV